MKPLKFTFEKSTKNTHRYVEQPSKGSEFVVGTLYIQKLALPNPVPESITVTIEEA